MTSPPGGRPPSEFGRQVGAQPDSWIIGSWSERCNIYENMRGRTYAFAPTGRLKITPVDVNTPINLWWKLTASELSIGNSASQSVYQASKGSDGSLRMTQNGVSIMLFDCSKPSILYTAKPSFDCVGDLNWVQKTVCTSAGLAAQDRELNALAKRLSDGGHGEDVTRINARWRNEWDDCGGSGDLPACIGSAYRHWIADLQSVDQARRSDEVSASAASVSGDAPLAGYERSAAAAVPDAAPMIMCVLPDGREEKLTAARCDSANGMEYR